MSTGGLSRPKYLVGTVAVVVGGMVLVSVLAVVFARASSTPQAPPARGFTFGRASTGLDVVSGDIVVEQGRATATRASASEPAVALTDALADEGQMTVTAVDPVPGWGLVVRWEDAREHWFVAVGGEDGLLELGVVHGGEDRVLDTASAPLQAGAEVDVRFDSKRVDVRVDGGLVASARGRDVQGRRAGLWAESVGPTWDDLRLGPRPAPVIRDAG